MGYRCQICKAQCNHQLLRHTVYRAIVKLNRSEIVQEIPVCKECQDLLMDHSLPQMYQLRTAKVAKPLPVADLEHQAALNRITGQQTSTK